MNTTVVSEAQLLSLTERISAKLLSEHPVSSEAVTGEEIKSFFPHGQLNSFLLFQIYQVWDQRVQQLKHPYFDFSSEDVQEVLESLKNRLAHHIAVDKDSFQSLVDRSVANTLGFIIDPQNGFKQFFYPNGQDLSIGQLEQYSHFFSDWDFVVNSILKYCQKHKKDSISWSDFSTKMERVLDIYEQKKGQSILEYRKGLYHSLTGEDLDSYLQELERLRAEEEAARLAKEAEIRRQEEMEAARKRAEEEQKRLEAERLAREEEERLRKEAEASKKTIFDDLGGSGETLDLDDEDLDQAPTKQVAAIIEEAPEPVVEETPVVNTVSEEPTEVDEDKEFMEMAASLEPVNEAAPEVEEPKTTFDQLTNGTPSFLDRFQAKKEAEENVEESNIQEVVQEAKEKIAEPVEKVEETVTPVVEGEVSTPSDQEDSASILDKIQEKSQTVADKFAEQTRARKLHESMNGNQKIKLDEIPIHKQYQYVQKVFGGNNVRFRIIVDRINDARDANEVEDILNKFVLSIDDLDREDPVVQEFVQMLRNRF